MESISQAAFFPATLMLISAIVHAVIGVVLKKSKDKLAFRAVLAVTSALIVLPLAFFVPMPQAGIWTYLIGGAILHFIYQLSQISAFERGDMSLVYPIMRGTAPALAGVAAFFFLKEKLLPHEVIGLAIAVISLIWFGYSGKAAASDIKGRNVAVGFALLCGVMIALYSVVDGAGMRMSRATSGQVWGYMVWFFLLDCVLITPLALYRRRGKLRAVITKEFRWGTLAGISSLITFGLALYAFSLAPIAQMSAMRETSVVFGAVFAALILKEPFGARRIWPACALAAGLILMQL